MVSKVMWVNINMLKDQNQNFFTTLKNTWRRCGDKKKIEKREGKYIRKKGVKNRFWKRKLRDHVYATNILFDTLV